MTLTPEEPVSLHFYLPTRLPTSPLSKSSLFFTLTAYSLLPLNPPTNLLFSKKSSTCRYCRSKKIACIKTPGSSGKACNNCAKVGIRCVRGPVGSMSVEEVSKVLEWEVMGVTFEAEGSEGGRGETYT